jgi:hypothetical protein
MILNPSNRGIDLRARPQPTKVFAESGELFVFKLKTAGAC